MLNIPDLERRWRRYTIRSRMSVFVFIAVTGFVLVGIVVVSGSRLIDYVKPRISEAQTKIPSKSFESSSTDFASSTPAPVYTAHVLESKVHLSPSMDFMDTFTDDTIDNAMLMLPQPVPVASSEPTRHYAQASSTPSLFQRTKPRVTHPQKVSVSSVPEIQQVSISSPPKKRILADIKREKSMADIQDVIERFKKKRNPALSLFIAKRFYELGNYQEAYNFALMTNDLNSNIEDSWLTFAKSLYQLNRKEMAIKTLQTYILESNSVKAKILLDQMGKGTFR